MASAAVSRAFENGKATFSGVVPRRRLVHYASAPSQCALYRFCRFGHAAGTQKRHRFVHRIQKAFIEFHHLSGFRFFLQRNIKNSGREPFSARCIRVTRTVTAARFTDQEDSKKTVAHLSLLPMALISGTLLQPIQSSLLP